MSKHSPGQNRGKTPAPRRDRGGQSHNETPDGTTEERLRREKEVTQEKPGKGSAKTPDDLRQDRGDIGEHKAVTTCGT